MEGYARIAAPLHCLTRKTSKVFCWTELCKKAFDTLKQRLTSPPILAYLKFDSEFTLTTDASEVARGAVLSQVQDGKGRVVAYWSQQLDKSQRSYSTIEQEALAVVMAMKEFYPYLYGFHFKVVTDHNPLTCLKGLRDVGD